MGFGIIIASNNERISAEALSCLVEARVEQTLNEPARWALRFLDDISIKTGKPTLSGLPEFQPGRLITIAVERDNEVDVLVHGPLEEIDCNVTLGGPGSWVQYGGRDRRGVMDRVEVSRCWSGTASTAMTTLLAQGYQFLVDAEPTEEIYSELTHTLNQKGTDLQFVAQHAAQNNLSFWVTYEVLAKTANTLVTFETANIKSSPPRPEDAPADAEFDIDKLTLAEDAIELRLNVPNSECQSLWNFNANVDLEATGGYEVEALTADGVEQRANGEDPQAPDNKDALGINELGETKRTEQPVGEGDRRSRIPMAKAIVTEAGWFVKATLTTSASMLGGVLKPHDIVPLIGVSDMLDGNYQVSAVTHVITAAEHMMDISIRRNTLGKSKTKASDLAITGAA